jgi:hypothetical protein
MTEQMRWITHSWYWFVYIVIKDICLSCFRWKTSSIALELTTVLYYWLEPITRKKAHTCNWFTSSVISPNSLATILWLAASSIQCLIYRAHTKTVFLYNIMTHKVPLIIETFEINSPPVPSRGQLGPTCLRLSREPPPIHVPPQLSHPPPSRLCLAHSFCKIAAHCSSVKWLSIVT